MAKLSGGPGISSNSSLGDSQTKCVPNMRDKDIDDLSEAFWEGLTLTAPAQAYLESFLNGTALSSAKHLQADVFHWAPPVTHLILFTISGCMLAVASTNPTPKRSYKLMLVVAVLFSGFALACAFIATVGSVQVLNGLLIGDMSLKTAELIDGRLTMDRANWLHNWQAIQVSCVAVFYTCMGILFVA
ncbi:MAG: hypothetical protein M1833_000378 [Piccolia ochrophora]|nr:MAG: hypothetical protein M1833_000378 [Piccolia ochrophora]